MTPRLAPFLLGVAAVTAAYHAPPPAAGLPLPEEGAAALVEKGRGLLAKGDYPGARDAFLKAVEKDPSSVPARRGAARALVGLGLADEAIQQAYKGLDLTGNKDAELWVTAARAFLLKGDTLPAGDENIPMHYADAAAKASQALQIEPGLVEAYAVLAQAFRMQNRTPEALDAVAKGLEKAPGDFDLLFEQGQVFLKATDYAAAEQAFARAAEADPKSAEARYWRGFALAWKGSWDDATVHFVEAAVLDPSNKAPLGFIAKTGRKAPEAYRRILARDPGHAWAHTYLAWSLATLKDEAGALAAIRSALSLKPDDPWIRAWNGEVHWALGKRAEGVPHYLKALEMDATVKLAWDRLTEFTFAPGSPGSLDARKELIGRMAKIRPDSSDFWNNVGLFHRDTTKDYAASLQAYLKAAALAPDDQGIQNDTGLIYLFHGKSIGEDPRKGLPYFQRTLDLVEAEGQDPQMGYRDTLENLAVYYSGEVEKVPARALEYAEKRNDPDLLARLPSGIGVPSPRASGVAAWARKELAK